MLCEHPGYPKCQVQLSEYWEVDGRMLCEHHAHSARMGSDVDEDEDDEEWVQSAKSLKRVTKYIDLGSGLM